MLDRECMFKVRSYNKKDKKLKEHEVKALGIIWAKLPQYNAKNTVHVDDLEKNFVMNRECVSDAQVVYWTWSYVAYSIGHQDQGVLLFRRN